MNKAKAVWLNRDVALPGPHLSLCLSEAEFDAALDHLRIPKRDRPPFVKSDATTHFFQSEHGCAAVVCLQSGPQWEGVQVASLLVHEAVHVWKAHLEDIGEDEPGEEQEAYGVQTIAQTLMYEYARRAAHR